MTAIQLGQFSTREHHGHVLLGLFGFSVAHYPYRSCIQPKVDNRRLHGSRDSGHFVIPSGNIPVWLDCIIDLKNSTGHRLGCIRVYSRVYSPLLQPHGAFGLHQRRELFLPAWVMLAVISVFSVIFSI